MKKSPMIVDDHKSFCFAFLKELTTGVKRAANTSNGTVLLMKEFLLSSLNLLSKDTVLLLVLVFHQYGH